MRRKLIGPHLGHDSARRMGSLEVTTPLATYPGTGQSSPTYHVSGVGVRVGVGEAAREFPEAMQLRHTIKLCSAVPLATEGQMWELGMHPPFFLRLTYLRYLGRCRRNRNGK